MIGTAADAGRASALPNMPVCAVTAIGPDGVSRSVERLAALAAGVMRKDAVCVTAPGDDGVDFVSRYFTPAQGIPEDPVTGSAHCTLTPYWVHRLGRNELQARQLSRRSGELRCTLAGERVFIAGHAVLTRTGHLLLDEL